MRHRAAAGILRKSALRCITVKSLPDSGSGSVSSVTMAEPRYALVENMYFFQWHSFT